jgi:hypothetical protein
VTGENNRHCGGEGDLRRDLPSYRKNGYVTGELVAREATGRFFWGWSKNKSKYYIKNVAEHTSV